MKVINSTEYQTKDLKKIFIECCKIKLDSWKNLRVEVSYTKSRWITGEAPAGRWKVEIFLPRNPLDKEYIEARWTEPRPYAYLNFKRVLAWVFIHKLHHTLGRDHRGMIGNYYNHWRFYAANPEKMNWVDDLPLRKKEIKIKPNVDLQLKRYEHVIKMIEQKEKILKRLRNQIKKWNTKKRYYEKVLTAAGKLGVKKKGIKMRKHRIYYGYFKNPHYFVEVKKNLFDEWNAQDVRNITHRDIVKWRLRERDRRARTMLVTLSYIKQGCKETTKLLKTIGGD